MFVFDLGTSKHQELAETYAAVFYDKNRLRDWWNRDLPSHEILTEQDIVMLFDGSNGNSVMNMLDFNSEN